LDCKRKIVERNAHLEKGTFGLPIERDLYCKPQTFKELIEKHQKERKYLTDKKETSIRSPL